MDSRYDHDHHESAIYKQWQAADAFKPEINPEGQPYTILMPPPNANDPLHVGHAMFVSIEDIMIRYARMTGQAALWLPGTDHAGIETQFVFEKKLAKNKQSRFDFDRDTLYQKIWDYVQDNSDISVNQMKQLGASADWSRFKFTLDPDIIDLVLATFEQLHHDQLIYRDLQLVNYCTKCGTGYSELEVEHVERQDPLYYIKYGPFILATVRPETKFGDTAVAVHPNDPRYQPYIGQEIEVEGLLGTFKMKVIADEYIDPEFGTGVLKVTPAHDPNDFQIGHHHNLKVKQVIDFDGKLNHHTGPYEGMPVQAARKRVAEDLQTKGLIDHIDEDYSHTVGVCYRCKRILEPLPMAQFFINTQPLAKKALQALDSGATIIHGAGRDKILRHWLENLRDWNISRQIVWGIRIPVWYDTTLNENQTIVIGFLKDGQFIRGELNELLNQGHTLTDIKSGLQTLNAPKQAQYTISRTSPGDQFIQETDSFDTWFSSGQWPVVTLKTSQENDFDKFYPTHVMETGYDILPIWVMRMMLLGIYLTDKSPFQQVYLHGLVRDQMGQKMSKSKGNVINPLGLVEKYGADALRMALVMSTTPGTDSTVGESKVKGMRNFANKIWNAARFVLMQEATDPNEANEANYRTHLNQIVTDITRHLDNLRIGLAAETVYNEFWHWYCDQCIEAAKAGKLSNQALTEGLITFLKLLHPFMPFVTEAIWQQLPERLTKEAPLLIIAPWPQGHKA